jgi:DNA-binding CsgD family transcriptional regulator
MKFNVLVVEFASFVEHADSAKDLTLAYQRFIERSGFAFFCVKTVPADYDGSGPFDILSVSPHDDWFGRWATTQYAKSAPLGPRLRQEMRSISWTEFAEGQNFAEREVLDEASRHGICDGWATAFEIGRRRFEVLLLALAEHNLTPNEEIALHFASAYWGMKLFQLEHLRLSGKRALSDRERECLRWVAAGKTDWEMSRILGISEKTAQEHVGRAVTKLGAATRAQAVATALIGNLISL